VNPADNHSDIVVGTGPDLSIEKSLTGGSSTPKPGDLLTYTLHFKNNSRRSTSGNVWVTDTLPTGLEFISATQRLCGPGNYFCSRYPDNTEGQALAWDCGTIDNGGWNDFVVTVRVTDTAHFGDVLTNTALIASGDPSDVEPFYADNTSAWAITIFQYKTYLPVVMKQ
jgi:uncharacterized repeat protein (TIGR01451 family)